MCLKLSYLQPAIKYYPNLLIHEIRTTPKLSGSSFQNSSVLMELWSKIDLRLNLFLFVLAPPHLTNIWHQKILTEKGYVKRMNPNNFNLQHRGTIGKSVGKMRMNDSMSNFIVCQTHDHILYFRLEGKVALVTGGATGIGEAIVRLFRQHGAKVCIADVQDEAGQQVRDSVGGDPDVLFVHCDVTVEEDVSRAVDATAEKFGTLDIMVNNAGVTGNKVTDIRNIDFAEVRKVFDINVHGVFLGMKHAARIMIPNKKGSIISLASVASVIGGMGPHAYTASKHAVVGLTKNVAGELGRHGIRVNCVSPYAVPTGLSMPHLPQGERKDDAVKDFLAFVGGEANLKGVDLLPKDVAEAVLYLASDEARYISALNLLVDGGFTSFNPNLRAFDD